MNEDAFARRFYADRAELESLGIQLTVEKPADGRRRAGELLARARRTSTCPRSSSPTSELAALQTALTLLDGEFAYAEPLRLALQQISWGRPSPLRRARAAVGRARHHRVGRRPRALAAAGEDRDGDLPPQDDRVRLLHDGARRRRARARSTRTTCSSRAASSTSSATRTSASAIRVFRLSRIRGKVAYATKAEHDFQRPDRLRPARLRQRARTGSSATRGAPPRSGSPSASPGRSSATSAATARCARPTTDRRHGLQHRVRLRAPARLLGAAPRRARARAGPRPSSCATWPSASSCCTSVTPGTWTLAAAVAPSPAEDVADPGRDAAAGDRDPPRALRAAGDAGQRPHRGRPGRPAPGARPVMRARCRSPSPSCARTSTSSTSSTSAAAPTCCTPRSTTTGDRGRPRALLRQLRPPRPPAARRGQGAGRRDRPHRRAPPRGRAELGARQDRRRAGRRPDGAGPAGRHGRGRRLGDRARGLPRDRGAPAAAHGVLQGQRGRVLQRMVEPYALINGREGWYVASYDPAREAVRHFRLDRIKTAEATDETLHAAARGRSRRRRRGLAAHRRGRGLAHRARVDLARSARAGRARSAGWPTSWPTARSSSSCPSRASDWLVREVLKEAGDAAVIWSRPTRARPCAPRSTACASRCASTARPTRSRAAWSLRSLPCLAGEPPRPDHDGRATRSRVPARGARRDVRDQRPARLAAPDAALVRRAPSAGDADLGLDLRQVPEGAQPRARSARDPAGRGRRRVPRAARRDAQVRGRRAP